MSETAAPLVEAIIAVHDATRPLRRAVDSLLRAGLTPGRELRITVVCHNIRSTDLTAQFESGTITRAQLDTIEFLELHDGIRSPAGPFTLGLDHATADYVCLLGSDDHLEPGALRAWLSLANSEGCTAVIAPQRHASGATVRTPPVRPFRSKRLDGVRDRLAYRTAPLGLIERNAVERLGLKLAPGMTTGEDHEFSARLWFSGERIAFARRAPRYVIGDDARRRVTQEPRPVAEEFRAVNAFIAGAWFSSQPSTVRRSIVTKIVRVHVFSAAAARSSSNAWTPETAKTMAGLLARLHVAAPNYERSLSVADRRLLDVLTASAAPTSEIGRLAAARRAFGRPTTLLTRDPRALLLADAPLRFTAASALVLA